MLKKNVNHLGQLAILVAVYWSGNQLAAVSGLPIPGSVLGVVILFTLLATNIIKLEQVSAAADFLLKHLMFFFVPIAAGLMTSANIFLESGWTLIIALVAGAAVPFWAVGFITQILRRRRGACKI